MKVSIPLSKPSRLNIRYTWHAYAKISRFFSHNSLVAVSCRAYTFIVLSQSLLTSRMPVKQKQLLRLEFHLYKCYCRSKYQLLNKGVATLLIII